MNDHSIYIYFFENCIIVKYEIKRTLWSNACMHDADQSRVRFEHH